MTIWDDIGDVVDDVTRPVSTAVSDVFDALPGSEWVKDFANGPLRDFAKSSVGTVILRATATALSGGLAATLGPQIASTAWAMPGLVRGEPFDEAFWKEFAYRAEKTAQTVGTDAAGKALGDMLKHASDKLMDQAKASFPNLPTDEALRRLVDTSGLTPEKLAAQLGIRPDMAAEALNLVLREFRFPVDKYNFQTGEPLKTISSFSTGPAKVYDYTGVVPPTVNCPQWHAARAMGLSPTVLNALARKCTDDWTLKATSFPGGSLTARSLPPITQPVQAQPPMPPIFQPPYQQPPSPYVAPPSADDFRAMEMAEQASSSTTPAVDPPGAFGSRWPLIVGAGVLALALFVDFDKLRR